MRSNALARSPAPGWRPVVAAETVTAGAVVFSVLAIVAAPVAALTPVETLDVSPDVTVSLGEEAVADEEVARLDLGGLATRLDLGLAHGVSVDGFHDNLDGTVLFSLDLPATVGGAFLGQADVVLWDLATHAAVPRPIGAVPAGVDVDAVTLDGADLLVSFDVSVTLSGVVFSDEDLARWDGAAFSLAFDGSAAGIDPTLDLDGAHRLTNGHLLLSFDGGGVVAGIPFGGEDVLERDPVGGTWEMASDTSLVDPGWLGADVEAVAAREPVQIVPAGSLHFLSPAYDAYESQGFAEVVVTRTGGTSGSVSITYTASNGTASDGSDYTAVTGTLSWPAGDGAAKAFFVPLIDDSLGEGDETVLLSLTDPTGGAILGVPGAAVLTIIDDETTPPPVLAVPTLDSETLWLLVLLLAGAGHVALRARSG